MKAAINQVFIEEEQDSADFRAQMRVLEEEKQREEDLQNIASVIGDELIITHSAQIISLFASNQQTADYLGKMLAGYEDELSVDYISSLIEQGLGQDELESLIEQALTSASANIAKDKSSAKKQMAKIFELLAVLERTVRQNQTQLKNPEQLQNSLRQMQEKVRDLAKSGNVENIQKFLKEGELKTAIKQSVEVAAKKPETFRNAADDVSARIRESQQKATQTQNQQQSLRNSERPNLAAANLDISSRNLAMQNLMQKMPQQVLSQSQLVLNAAQKPITQNINAALLSNLQVNQAAIKPAVQQQLTTENRQVNIAAQQQVQQQAQQTQQNQLPSAEVKSYQVSKESTITPEKTAEPTIQNKSEFKVEPTDRTKEPPPTHKPETRTDKPIDKPADKPSEPPPTKVHVHTGDCCGPPKKDPKNKDPDKPTPTPELQKAVEKIDKSTITPISQEKTLEAVKAANVTKQSLTQDEAAIFARPQR